ncbi:MAG TPA: CAAX prenyl protease-related protein [Candidatus Udaeobacter sp.]
MSQGRKLLAYTLPMVMFLFLLGAGSVLRKVGNNVWFSSAEHWIYPVQTILCGALLIRFYREYRFRPPSQVGFIIATGVLVFALWISPQQFLGSAPRTVGFNPAGIFGNQSPLYWPTIILRFLRLVIVVPFVEEIFWRGFLLRYLIDENFERVRLGAFSWLSFSIVALAFAFSHSPADWPAALVTGAIYNGVAYRTKNLSSCILTHAITNLLLGLWIMKTKQWGFW